MKSNKNAFSLIEMAIVLVIFGLILASATSVLSLFVNKGGAERTRKMIESDKSSLYSFVSTNQQLPTSANFGQSVTYPQDGYGKPMFYYVDPILDKTMAGWNLGGLNNLNSVCGSFYTNTVVHVCRDLACTTFDTVNNVAFVIASGSDNKNMQTGVSSAGGVNIITVHMQGTDSVDDNAGDFTRNEKYDDIVDWVTLDELRTRAGCEPDRFRFLNTAMPAILDDSTYKFNFYIEGGIPYAYGGAVPYDREYKWKVDDTDSLSNVLNGGITPIFHVLHADGSDVGILTPGTGELQGAYLQLMGNSSTLNPQQYQITVHVIDKAAEAQNPGNPPEYTKTFVVNTQ